MSESPASETRPDPREQEIEKNPQIQQALNAILRISLEPISLDDQLHRVLDLLIKLPWLALEAQGCIFLVEEDLQELVLKVHFGMPAGARSTCSRVPVGTCLCGQAIATNDLVFAGCLDERHSTVYPGLLPHGHYCVPIACGERRIGVLNLYVREGHRRLPAEEQFLRAVADTLAGIIERQRMEKALRDSEAHKAAILATALDGIITMDHDGRILDFNAAAEKAFGYRRAEVLGQPLAELLVPPSLREQHKRGLARYLATGEGPILNRRVELSALRADGTEIPIELTVTRIANGGPPLFSGYLRDITERRNLEQRRTARLAVTQILAEVATLQEATPRILQALCEGLGWDVGCFWTLDRQAGVLRCVESWHRPSVREEAFGKLRRQQTGTLGVDLPGLSWSSGRPAWIANVTKEAHFPWASVLASEGLRGAFGFPIRMGEEVLGVMEFFSHAVREPDADLLEMVATIGGQIGQFMQRKRTEGRLAAEHAISRILAVSSTLRDAAGAILRVLCESLDWDVGAIWLVDRNADVLRCVEVWHRPGREASAWEQETRQRTFSPGVGLPGRVWASGTPVWVPDIAAEVDYLRAAHAGQAGLHGAVGFPIRNGVEFLGVIDCCSREIRQPDEEVLQMMSSIGGNIGQFIERRQAERELRRQENDRRIAQQIQQGLLPNALPRLPGFNLGGRSVAAQDVGGDCFDFLPMRVGDQETVGVLVADASGHGIGAALLVAETRAYLRALALACTEVDTLLTLSNQRLASDLVTGHFVTLFLMRLDPRTRTVVYANAGHWPGYVLDRQGGTKAILASTGGPLGIDPASEFPPGPALTLEPGELVLLFTDGIVEAACPEGKRFGLERTLRTVREYQHEPPDTILDALFQAVGGFSGHHLDDDITAVIIKAEGAG
jgi:PAS domain S-box-containing protein